MQELTSTLATPFCGAGAGQEAVEWLDDSASAKSVALIALRADATSPAFGLLVLAASEADRFTPGMGTDFLQRIGELASAALSRLRSPADGNDA